MICVLEVYKLESLETMANVSEDSPLLQEQMPYFASSENDNSDVYSASVFIEDGIHYRSVHHKIDTRSLKLYRFYYSWPIQLFLSATIFTILVLTFFEYPNSISASSDYKYSKVFFHMPEPDCGVTESVELVCLVIFLLNWIVQFNLVGAKRFIKQPWLVLYAGMVILSFMDLFISIGFCYGMGQQSIGATLRLRRFFRPFFFIVPSSIMKKFIKAVGRTVMHIFGVFVLLMLHIYVFAMIGMLIFPEPISRNSTNDTTDMDYLDDSHYEINDTNSTPNFLALEGRKYFNSLEDSLISLLVLLTTANNPDVMTQIYQGSRISFLYFFLFLSIGLYLILNLFTAAVYSEFRGYLEQSMQSSFLRRRVAFRAAFAILARNTSGRFADKNLVRQILQKAKIPSHNIPSMYTQLETINSDSDYIGWDTFRDIFDLVAKDQANHGTKEVEFYSRNRLMESMQRLVRNNIFQYFSIGMTFVHVSFLTVEMEIDYHNVVSHSDSGLAYANFFFFFYYIFEQVVKILGLGKRGYFFSPANLFEGITTAGILITELVILSMYGAPFFLEVHEPHSYTTLIQIMNLLIVFRLLRIIPQFRSVSIAFGTMLEILKNLRAFAGIIIVIYYLFALLGMAMFGENYVLDQMKEDRNTTCGKYEYLQYNAYNFHDFAAALVLLWNIMVVNNWHVFLEAFSYATNKWAQLYFIAWWLVSVIITINLFISLVIEVFLTRWEVYNGWKRHERMSRARSSVTSNSMLASQSLESYTAMAPSSDVRLILSKNLVEPSESILLHEIHQHKDIL